MADEEIKPEADGPLPPGGGPWGGSGGSGGSSGGEGGEDPVPTTQTGPFPRPWPDGPPTVQPPQISDQAQIQLNANEIAAKRERMEHCGPLEREQLQRDIERLEAWTATLEHRR